MFHPGGNRGNHIRSDIVRLHVSKILSNNDIVEALSVQSLKCLLCGQIGNVRGRKLFGHIAPFPDACNLKELFNDVGVGAAEFIAVSPIEFVAEKELVGYYLGWKITACCGND